MSKILYLVPEDYGFISHRLELARESQKLGYEIVVVTRCSDYANAILKNNFKLIQINQKQNERHSNVIKNLLNLISIYRNEKPDIVHHFTLRMIILGTIAAKFSNKTKIINTITGLGSAFIYETYKYKIIRKVISSILKYLLPSSLVTVQNNDDYSYVKNLGIHSDRVSLILGSGVDTKKYSPIHKTNSIPLVVFPSRMLWVKGLNEFVVAAKILFDDGINCRFALVGDKDENNPSSVSDQTLLSWEKDEHIEWWGHQKDMISVLGKADIVCLPTYREGLPKSLLEAASAGLPIVATNVPGCREVVEDGYNGLLVPPKDSKRLSIALKKLITSKDLRDTMGANGRKKILDSLSSKIVITKTIELYKSALSDP
jgi:glycosyltransferase involved in cell wall biosynthesis